MGQQILSGNASRTLQIDFSSQPKGIYVLQILGKGKTITKKIVVQ